MAVHKKQKCKRFHSFWLRFVANWNEDANLFANLKQLKNAASPLGYHGRPLPSRAQIPRMGRPAWQRCRRACNIGLYPCNNAGAVSDLVARPVISAIE